MNLDRNNVCLIIVRFAIFACLIELGASTSVAVSIGPDAFGYRATNDFFNSFTNISASGTSILDDRDDSATAPISLGFNFNFYGTSYSHVHLSTNGMVTFGAADAEYSNADFASINRVLPTIAPFWDDWRTEVNDDDRLLYQLQTGPTRFVVQWDKVYSVGSNTDPVTFQAVFYSGSNRIDFNYSDVNAGQAFRSYGGSATIGIADSGGATSGNNLQWSFNSPVIVEGRTIGFYPPTLPLPFTSPATYSFKKIVENTTPAFSDLGRPAINNQGTVAFRGTQGVYSGDGGSISTIDDGAGPRNAFNDPSINDNGVLAFRAAPDTGGSGIFIGSGGAVTTISDNQGPFSTSFGNGPQINTSGTVVFHAGLDTGGIGIFTSTGGPATAIATTNAPTNFSNLAQNPSINDGGVVAFRGTHNTLSSGIFTGNGGPTTTIASTNGPVFDSVGSAPMINNGGTVAFFATLDAGGAGIFTGNGGATTTIADTSGPYESFSNYAINDAGTVVFEADLDGGGTGIFTGPDYVTNKVIRTGDLLFGSIVTGLEFFQGINDQGEIAFIYTLASNMSGIAVALIPISGDYNRDAVVDAADYVVWRNSSGQAGAGLAADGNNDGVVNGADYELWRAHFGQTAGSGSVVNSLDSRAAVPEPASFLLFIAALMVVGIRRSWQAAM